jgi:diguanylate cyclase (GGDEF)-like protein/PAS domain S-box-containing protein
MTIRIGRVEDLSLEQDTKYNSLLAAIARSAEELTSGKGWPDGVIDLMADLGRITRVSRVWIFQLIELTDDHIIQDYPFEWADRNDHVQLSLSRFNTFRKDLKHASPEYMQMLESRKRGEWQSMVVSQLPEGELKEDLASQGILSMLTIPIIVEGKWWGILGFDDCLREYRWSEVEIALLRTATYLLSNAILRDRLSAKTKQFNILKGVTDASAWELDVASGHFWCSPELLFEQTGLTENIHLSLRQILHRIHPHDRKKLLADIRQHISRFQTTFRKDLRICQENGKYVWVEIIAKISRDTKDRIQKIAGIAVEILKRKQEEEKLRTRARKDSLTGAENRGSFDKELAGQLHRFNENGTIFSLLLLDIDHFKRINDTWGHAVGDKALRHVTNILNRNLRGADRLFRIGGEEFAILLSGINETMAASIGERIRKDIESTPMNSERLPIALTVSIGAAGVAEAAPCESIEKLYQMADHALYTAKERGRNLIVQSRQTAKQAANPS